MRKQNTFTKIIVWIVLGSAIVGIGGIIAKNKKSSKYKDYLWRWFRQALDFLKSLVPKKSHNDKQS